MNLLKPFGIYCFGGLAYGVLEIIYRGQTHISMFWVGGLCFLVIAAIDSIGLFGGSLVFEAPVCAAFVTAVEFVSGVIINLRLGLGVWDYSGIPLNLMGQICLPFSVIWLGLSVPAAVSARLIRHLIFGEELPELRLLPARAVAVGEDGANSP